LIWISVFPREARKARKIPPGGWNGEGPMATRSHVRWFDDLRLAGVPPAGGKNASLGELRAALFGAGTTLCRREDVERLHAQMPPRNRRGRPIDGGRGANGAAKRGINDAMTGPAGWRCRSGHTR
jgi:hypothetical protein